MNNSTDGLSFEQRAFRLLECLVVDGKLGVIPHCSKIFHRKPYHSRDRNSDIVFDISIEITLPSATQCSFLWLWECKDYSGSIPVNDVEEFNSKILQVAGLNVKGGIITPNALQRAAFDYAASRKLSVIRILPRNLVRWELYNPLPDAPPHPADYVTLDACAAITQPAFRSKNCAEFAASHGYAFGSVKEMIEHVLREETPGVKFIHEIELEKFKAKETN